MTPNIIYQNVPEHEAFLLDITREVNLYFKETKQTKFANKTAKRKAVLLLTLYLTIYVFSLFVSHPLALYICFGLLGILTVFCALNIGHDAAHGTFSADKKVNNALLFAFDFLGASGKIWQAKHVYSHHMHVNIPKMDGDIKQSNWVRIFPNAPFYFLHRFQHIYMPVLYMFYTIFWLFVRDVKDFFRPHISGKREVKRTPQDYAVFFGGKLFFIFRMIVLPVYLLPFSFATILWAFIIFNVCASVTVAMALTASHVGEAAQFPAPDQHGVMPQSWVMHQLLTTSDFATKSRVLFHLYGGFTHHIAHHFFPRICHIHYPKITAIIKQYCNVYQLPYQERKSLLQAVFSHFMFLKMRSNPEVLQAPI